MEKKSANKNFFRKAGEVIGTIGHEIAESKDKVVATSHNIIDSIKGSSVKDKKTPVKKAAKKVATKKSVFAKKPVAKVIKKAAKKVAKKTAKADKKK